jgi:hypothetical protein
MRVAIVVSFLLAGCTPKEPVEIGAPCSVADKVEACAVGKLAVCSGGKWQETMTCPGGCSRKTIGHGSTAAICDDAVARAGKLCNTWHQRICSEDRHTQLVCEGGRWHGEASCAEGCSWGSKGIECR